MFNSKKAISLLMLFLVILIAVSAIGSVSATDDSEIAINDINDLNNLNNLNETIVSNDIRSDSNNLNLYLDEDDYANELNTGSSSNNINEGNFTALQDLINNPSSGNYIILDKNYTFDKELDISITNGINITKDLTIDGNGSVINGAGLARGFNIDGDYTVTIKNITIINCYSMGNGGAIYNRNGYLTIIDVMIYNCTASNGGAIYNDYESILNCNGTIDIINCSASKAGAILNEGNSTSYGKVIINGNLNIDNCSASGFKWDCAGAFCNNGFSNVIGSIVIKNCNMTNETSWAGAIFNSHTLDVSGSINISNCYASFGGAIFNDNGAILNNNGTIYIDGCSAVYGSAIFNNYYDGNYGKLNINGNLNVSNCNASEYGAIFNLGILNVTDSIEISNCSDSYGSIAIVNYRILYVSGSIEISNCSTNLVGAFYSEGIINVSSTNLNLEYFYSSAGILNIYNSTVNITGSTFKNSNKTALNIINSTVTIINSSFYNNTDKNSSAAIYNENSTLKVINSKFTNNTANCGGAIYNYMGYLDCINSTFIDCYAVGDESEGGAILNSGNSTFYNSTFENCYSNNLGGAIENFNSESFLVCNNSSFINCSANYGGALYNNEGTFEIINISIINCTAEKGGSIYNNNEGYVCIGFSDLTLEDYYSDGGTIGILNDSSVKFINSTFINSEEHSLISEKSNVTIINSIFSNNSNEVIEEEYDAMGAAIAVLESNLEIISSEFINNYATDGAAIALLNSNATVEDCNFSRCVADCGGAICTQDSNLKIISSEFINNSATHGAAIGLIESYATVEDCNFSRCVADYGGAIYIQDSDLVINADTTFSNCNVSVSGGAIYNKEGNLTLCNCEFINNTAYNGGVIYNDGGSLNCSDCEFINNTAWVGGAISNIISIAKIENCYFWGGATEHGGAIYNNNGSLIFSTYNEFSNCNATQDGGFIYNLGFTKVIGVLYMSNCNVKDCGGAIENVGVFDIYGSLIIKNSHSEQYAGAIHNYENCSFNVVGAVDIYYGDSIDVGGAILNEGNLFIKGTLGVTRCNSISSKGGAIFNTGNITLIGNLDIEDCDAFIGKSVYNEGNITLINGTSKLVNYHSNNGFINLTNYDMSFKFSEFINSVNHSALYAKDSILSLANCNFENNTAIKGSALYIDSGSYYEITKSRIYNNTNPIYLNSEGELSNCWFGENITNADELIDKNIIENDTNFDLYNPAYMVVNNTYIDNKNGTFDILVDTALVYDNEEGIREYLELPNGIKYTFNETQGKFNFDYYLENGFDSINETIAKDQYFDCYILLDNQKSEFAIYPKVNTYINASNLKITAYDKDYLVITLYNETNDVLADKEVTFTFNGKTYTRITDENGQANISISSIYVKTYPVTITYSGDEYNLSSTKTVNVTIVPAYVTIKQIITAANYLKNYGKKYKKLPTTVKIGSVKCTIAQASYLMTAAYKYYVGYKKSVNTKIKVINVKATTKNTKGEIKSYKKSYTKIFNTLYSKGLKGSLPTTIKVNGKTVGFNQYTFAIAKIISFGKLKYRLPNYVVFSGKYIVYTKGL